MENKVKSYRPKNPQSKEELQRLYPLGFRVIVVDASHPTKYALNVPPGTTATIVGHGVGDVLSHAEEIKNDYDKKMLQIKWERIPPHQQMDGGYFVDHFELIVEDLDSDQMIELIARKMGYD